MKREQGLIKKGIRFTLKGAQYVLGGVSVGCCLFIVAIFLFIIGLIIWGGIADAREKNFFLSVEVPEGATLLASDWHYLELPLGSGDYIDHGMFWILQSELTEEDLTTFYEPVSEAYAKHLKVSWAGLSIGPAGSETTSVPYYESSVIDNALQDSIEKAKPGGGTVWVIEIVTRKSIFGLYD